VSKERESVPLSHPLVAGTVGQQRWSTSSDKNRTHLPTIKALAYNIIRRQQRQRPGVALREEPLPWRNPPDASPLPSIELQIIEWRDQYPAPSGSGRCAWCGGPEAPGTVVVPFGVLPATHAWLHCECWSDWHRAQQNQAVRAL
jgi:hypothetical protein